MLLSVLTIRPGSAEAGAFIELVDRLADSGLQQFLPDARADEAAPGDLVRAEIAQATIPSRAVPHHRRRDAEAVMAALEVRIALIFRERKTLNATGFVALHLRPPDGVAIKNRAYPPSLTSGLAALTEQTRGHGDPADHVDVDAMVDFLLPAARHRRRRGPAADGRSGRRPVAGALGGLVTTGRGRRAADALPAPRPGAGGRSGPIDPGHRR
jgi:hypothetical protein